MAAKKRGNIDYENISVEELAQEVLVRAKSIFQNAKYRFEAQGRQDLVDKITKARKIACVLRLQKEIDSEHN